MERKNNTMKGTGVSTAVRGGARRRERRFAWMAGVFAAALALTFASCAATPASRSFFSGFSPELSDVNGSSSKIGIAKSIVWIGFIGGRSDTRVKDKDGTGFLYNGLSGGFSYPPIATAAQNGGITRIASVEYYTRIGVLGIWTTYITIVTGE